MTISANEARTLLRAALPLPISATRLREPHARLLAALHLFTGHLLSLNDPVTAPDHAAGAAITLMDELRAWTATARWHQACRAAGVRWPPPAAIRAITRHQTARDPEHAANTLPGLAEAHRTAADPMGAQVARTTRAAAQDALDLATETTPAQVVPLHPPTPSRKTYAA